MHAVDMRLIFDDEEQELVIGCHACEKTASAPINDIPKITVNITTFEMEHLRTCSQKI